MKIDEFIDKKYNCDANYQRGEAWKDNISSLLIDSIFNNYYIPPILIANNEIVDGKQRYNAIRKFINNKIAWNDKKNSKRIKWNELKESEKKKFYDKDININDLGQIDRDKLIETFIRINKCSIRLNEIEMIYAEATQENRNFINEISAIEEIRLLSNNKKNDKRFNIKNLCLWVFTIINMMTYNENRFYSKSVRNETRKILKYDIDNNYKKKTLSNIKTTIKIMYNICFNDTIPIKSFNVIFISIFMAFYSNIKSLKNFENNKDDIRISIKGAVKKLLNMQMGGGTKYDNIDEIIKRINVITEILAKYNVDSIRGFSYDQKLDLWNKSNKKCEICKNEINNINDAEIDHIIPHCYGGKTQEDNARVLCRKCNRSEGGKISKR